LTRRRPAHIVPRHDVSDNHDENQKALGGFGSRARV